MLLVTGITGHTGKCFLNELIKNKYDGPIRCIIRETSKTTQLDNSGLNVEKVIGNLDNKETIARAMTGVDTVLHIYNIHYSPIIVAEAIRRNVKRVILVHTTGIYSHFKKASEEYKKIEERVISLVDNSGSDLSITILRPTMIYGDLCDHNISKFIAMMDKLIVIPIINHGSSLIQPVNARDLGKVYYSMLINPESTAGKVYNISGDRPIKMVDVFKLISQELNKNTRFISFPLSLGVFMARVVKLITFGKRDYIEKVQRMGEDRSYSHEDAIRDIGYNPMSIEEGIHIEVQEYLDQQRL